MKWYTRGTYQDKFFFRHLFLLFFSTAYVAFFFLLFFCNSCLIVKPLIESTLYWFFIHNVWYFSHEYENKKWIGQAELCDQFYAKGPMLCWLQSGYWFKRTQFLQYAIIVKVRVFRVGIDSIFLFPSSFSNLLFVFVGTTASFSFTPNKVMKNYKINIQPMT